MYPMSPIKQFLAKMFHSEDTVDYIISRFELYNVSDLAKLTDAEIDSLPHLRLSYGEKVMLKRLVSRLKSTGSQQIETRASQPLKTLLTQLRDL
jgi:hypothetical protein